MLQGQKKPKHKTPRDQAPPGSPAAPTPPWETGASQVSTPSPLSPSSGPAPVDWVWAAGGGWLFDGAPPPPSWPPLSLAPKPALAEAQLGRMWGGLLSAEPAPSPLRHPAHSFIQALRAACVHSGSKPGVPATAPGQPRGTCGDRCTWRRRLRAGQARGRRPVSRRGSPCGLWQPQVVSGARALPAARRDVRWARGVDCRWQGPAQQEERSAPVVHCSGRRWAPVHRGTCGPALSQLWDSGSVRVFWILKVPHATPCLGPRAGPTAQETGPNDR